MVRDDLRQALAVAKSVHTALAVALATKGDDYLMRDVVMASRDAALLNEMMDAILLKQVSPDQQGGKS